MQEEIYGSRFQSFCYGVFISKSASRSICGTCLLFTNISAGALTGNE